MNLLTPACYLPIGVARFLETRYGGRAVTPNGVWADWHAPTRSQRVWLCSEVSNEGDLFVFTEQVTLPDGRILQVDARCTVGMTRARYTVREDGRIVYCADGF